MRTGERARSFREAHVAVHTIEYIAGLLGINDKELARIAGRSASTWVNRKNKPQDMTVGELIAVARTFRERGYNVSVGQLFTALTPDAVPPLDEA